MIPKTYSLNDPMRENHYISENISRALLKQHLTDTQLIFAFPTSETAVSYLQLKIHTKFRFLHLRLKNRVISKVKLLRSKATFRVLKLG